MTADKNPPSDNGHTTPAVTAAKQQAADRLAKALRDNLHRRKAQAERANKPRAAPRLTDWLTRTLCEASKADS